MTMIFELMNVVYVQILMHIVPLVIDEKTNLNQS
jgi:hypothetical protein